MEVSIEQARESRLNKTEPLIRHTKSRRVSVAVPATKIKQNTKLHKAKAAKNDEFYTRYQDIESEITAYVKHDSNVFRDKTILLPCDDLATSNFTKFFIDKFDEFGLKRLISTAYKRGGRGKLFIFDRDTGVGCVDIDGDGDFRSAEVRALRDEADVIITNPPFSIVREYIAWLTETDKQFILIAPKTCVSYKHVFPLIHKGKMWVGARPWAGGMNFEVPNDAVQFTKIVDGVKLYSAAAVWFTNIDHDKRRKPIKLSTMVENMRRAKLKGKEVYAVYDNYDAIAVSEVAMIPSDYEGVVGVPTTFIDKYCPEQFEIIGMSESGDDVPLAYLRKPGYRDYHRPCINGAEKWTCLFIRHTEKSLRGELT